MIFVYLPMELLLHIGSYLSRRDLIFFATTCKAIRTILMIQLFGGTIQIRSPLPDCPGVLDVFNFLHQRMPGLQRCIDQVLFYRRHGDLASSIHTLQMTNWITPSPRCFWSAANRLATTDLTIGPSLLMFSGNRYYSHALMEFGCIYDFIFANLVQFLRCSELRLIRAHITPTVHLTLKAMSSIRSLTLESCTTEEPNFRIFAGQGQYHSLKATAGVAWQANHLSWNTLYAEKAFIQFYIFRGLSTLTKLEICIEFLDDDALDRLSLPSLTSLAIVPHENIHCRMWSWRTVYLVLKISPNITCFRFEPLRPLPKVLYPFADTSNWKEYKRRIGNLPLSQLSSITAYRQLLKCLVPGRPVSFVKILLFPENIFDNPLNWPGPESDDEDMPSYRVRHRYIVPYQLVRSATPIKTLYLQRIYEGQELDIRILGGTIESLRDTCPYVTDLWIPSLKITRRRRHYRDPNDVLEVLGLLNVWQMTLERCAIGSCSPWMAKELEWYREGTIIPRRVHPTLKELLLGVDVLWKWHDDSEVTGWVLYISTDIEGSEDSEEGIHPPYSPYADSVSSDEPETDSQ